MKYIDLIAYPLAMLVVYIFIGLLNWNSDPSTWDTSARALWVMWGLTWGWVLQSRIARGGTP
jgi:hypothetical protein